jgi:isoleucyl-tRNA synthetase
MLAPVLVFTADEIWENLPRASEDERVASVHMAEFNEARATVDSELLMNWARLFEVRELVMRKLEAARSEKAIGSSLEAHVVLIAQDEHFKFLQRYQEQLRYIFIVSQVSLLEVHTARGAKSPIGISVEIKRANGEKCERCWNYSVRVGESERYPAVCERCVAALAEIEGEQGA